MELRLLGEVTAEVDGQPVDLGTPRQRCVLAALAVDAGRVVPVDRLVERVWGVDAAPRARATLHGYISRLRRVLAGADGAAIVRRSGGYALVAAVVEPVVDLHRFRDLRLRACDESGQAARLLTEALALWRGEALTGLQGQWAWAERDRLGQERLAAEQDLVDARLRVGTGGDLVAELSARSAQHPLDERVQGQYVVALHQLGRTADALEHYRQVRERLVEELGTEPGSTLRELHQRILTADSALTPTPTTAVPAPPRQLPMPPTPFVGRQDALDTLGAALDVSATVAVSVIGGAGGVGKTWLALRWAHWNLHRFPEGQLFVDLQGFSPTGRPTEPGDALRGFLDALGVAPTSLPPDLDARAALYRSLVAGRRMLVLLDNAATIDQVLPLLPGSATCTVLVTGRTALPSLIDRYGARHLPLDVLSRCEARALLASRLGAERVDVDPEVTDELVELCGRHPLALAITARHAATHSTIPLAEFAAELRDSGLDMLDHDTDPASSLPTVLSWSLRHLTDRQRRLFALLGTAPAQDVDLPAAASLVGLGRAEARKELRVLEDNSLVDRRPQGRYAMHDLVRAYAATTAHDHLTETERRAALERVVDFYLHTSHTADRLLNPHRELVRLDPPTAGVCPHPLAGVPAATAWFEAEHTAVLAAQRVAASNAWHSTVWHLAWTLNTFQTRQGRLRDNLAAWSAALDAASHLPDPTFRIHAHRRLGHAHTVLGRREEGLEQLRRALALAEQNHDATQQAHTHRALAGAWERLGEHERALNHANRTLGFYRLLGQPAWEAAALNAVGWYTARLGDYDTARTHCEDALALQRCHRDRYGEASTLDSLGYIAHHSGDHGQAVHYYQQALVRFRDLENTYHAAEILDRLGRSNTALGRYEHAVAAWREAWELYVRQGRIGDGERVQRQLDGLPKGGG
ncbi:AfsR/SARP family transcriptional regulator [Saccharothrix sp. NRRL B-16314]|uniref:AfsR/SARP family transcriptional regulator n=1 Tax=Saccharothrix sp. NRRL B-16314 TaxID=1463825 RepID=UPI000A93FCAD